MFIELPVYTDNGPGTAFANQIFKVDDILNAKKAYYWIGSLSREYVEIERYSSKKLQIAMTYDQFRDKILSLLIV